MTLPTEEEVRGAYRATGLKPRAYTSVPVDGKCCAGGALAVHKLGRHLVGSEAAYRFVTSAFAIGFDSGILGYDRPRMGGDYSRGYEIGKALRERPI